MNISPLKTSLLLSSILFIATPAISSEQHHEHREHGAHEHGKAVLNVALDGQKLFIELESPAMNIVGFEHEAHSQEDKQAVNKATKLLHQGEALFVLPNKAQCQLVDIDIDSELLEHNDHEGHDDHDGHSEFHAQYEFACKTMSALNNINLQILHTFEGIHELKVQLISDHGQSTSEMSASHTVLSIK